MEEEWEYLEETKNIWGDIVGYLTKMKKEGWELVRMGNGWIQFRRKKNNHLEIDLRYKQAYDD